ncbi:MAG: DUF177 domain-containing protein [Dysgonamonadaceae bacterium]|jgi:uncharacterized metal-binding protein YceD (DUF177 family)|nr:DUF177 domain-containing protein [Dysgonamonadaceae bacterium]
MKEDVLRIEYQLGNSFFVDIDEDNIQKGKVKVNLTIKKAAGVYDMSFVSEGVVIVPCDRCLDDMELPVSTSNRLIVKFGKDYSEESDEIVVIPESEGIINLAWFLYEFIVLTIPIKHVHSPGKCNKAMTSTLKKYTPKKAGDDDDEEISVAATDLDEDSFVSDPRWDALKNFKEEDPDNN